jgi:NAD(P)-dependent dehydrogenase (short-subunit alcohol dehydrogenase family)
LALDICAPISSIPYALATTQDLDETVRAVGATGRRVVARAVDVRDRDGLGKFLTDGVAELGHLDVVVANAGICSMQSWDEITPELWRDTLDVDLTGVWNTLSLAAPHVIAAGGGSMMATSSNAGLKGLPWVIPYVTAKHGLVGMCRALGNELARHNVRVNTVHPTGVQTDMVVGLNANGAFDRLFASDTKLGSIFYNALDVDMIEPRDISDAMLFLASDESRYITGLAMTVDAGSLMR